MTHSINRRKFLRQAGFAGSTLAVGFYFSACQKAIPEPEGIIELFKLNIDDIAKGIGLNPFVIIEKTGLITIMAHKPDMGQGTNQSMPMLIAEELDVDLDQVVIKQAMGDPQYGFQGVGGSASVRTMWEPMRKMGAAAREMLLQAAAQQWGIAVTDCYTEKGMVINKKSQEKLKYGDLVAAASELEVPETPRLKTPEEFKLIGQSLPRPSVELKVRGAANFGMDMKRKGMVFALIERSPTFSGTVKSIDDAASLAIPGVQKVMKTSRKIMTQEFEGVAVIADSYWAALQGRRALKVEWEEKSQLDTEQIYQQMRERSEGEGLVFHSEGKFKKVYNAKAVKQVTAQYETPFLAHAAMEPQNVLVEVKEDHCEVWASTQFPQWAQGDVANLLGLKPEQVTIHVAYLGGGFGRRALTDFVLEGASLSKALQKPVKVVWTREDDMTQSPFRPGSVNTLSGALDENGRLLALQHKVATPSIMHSLRRNFDGKKVPGSPMEPIGEAFYDVPNYESRYVFVDVDPLPLVWWRSVYSSTNVFAHEVFIDELAEAAGKDPMAFRLAQLDNKPNYKRLLTFLADKAGWNQSLPAGKARGVALTNCFETTAGHVVEVSRNEAGKIQIDRIVTAIDCGIAVNPDNVRAQCEGCVVMGLTAAIKDPIQFKNGRAVEDNFHNYRMLRINEMPKVEVHILPSTANPTGVGEPALPPLAPALVNAIYQLTGKRIRKLPFDLETV
ncbi:MAG: molybdopterin cofactor-binding domain-containing protein [Bacteroidota bacterium]